MNNSSPEIWDNSRPPDSEFTTVVFRLQFLLRRLTLNQWNANVLKGQVWKNHCFSKRGGFFQQGRIGSVLNNGVNLDMIGIWPPFSRKWGYVLGVAPRPKDAIVTIATGKVAKLRYCWWKKSCSTRDITNILTGAGFLPSTSMSYKFFSNTSNSALGNFPIWNTKNTFTRRFWCVSWILRHTHRNKPRSVGNTDFQAKVDDGLVELELDVSQEYLPGDCRAMRK